MKKLICLLLVAAVLCALAACTNAGDFADVKVEAVYYSGLSSIPEDYSVSGADVSMSDLASPQSTKLPQVEQSVLDSLATNHVVDYEWLSFAPQGSLGGFSWCDIGTGIALNYDPDKETNGNMRTTLLDKACEWELSYYGCADNSGVGCGYDYHCIEAIVFCSEREGVLAECVGGGAGSSYYNIYRTSDGGKSWTLALNNINITSLCGITLLSADKMLVYRSIDAYPYSRMDIFDFTAGEVTELGWLNLGYFSDIKEKNEGDLIYDVYGYITGVNQSGFDFVYYVLLQSDDVYTAYKYPCKADIFFNVTEVGECEKVENVPYSTSYNF